MLLEGNQLHVAEQYTEKPTCIESSIKGKNTEITLLIFNNCIVSFKQNAPSKRKHRTEKLTGGFWSSCLLWFMYGMCPTGLYVWTLGPQLIVPSWKVVELLWREQVNGNGPWSILAQTYFPSADSGWPIQCDQQPQSWCCLLSEDGLHPSCIAS